MRSLLLVVFVVGIASYPNPLPASSEASQVRAASSSLSADRHGTFGYSDDAVASEVQIPGRACGTAPPSDYLIDAHRTLQAAPMVKRASPRMTKYTVDTWFHIVSTSDERNMVTRAMVANQFGALQQAYGNSNISFNLLGVDFTVNDSWATDKADADMKNALRQGNYSTLNVYFQTNLSTSAYGAETQLLGYCTLPTNITYIPCSECAPVEYPEVEYAADGCNVLAGSMPNGPVVGYNTGKTAVHEIGHWFGLLHTFQDETCTKGDPGDYIDDTPQESVSTDGCPAGKDSCPYCPGLDPINNYMDYSTDSCYENFTTQQVIRMQDMYETLRLRY